MAKRISITPKDQLKLIPQRWQGRFAEMAAEILIKEGRCGEVLQVISGLSLSDLTGESLPMLQDNKKPKKHIQRVKQANNVENLTDRGPQESIDAAAGENSIQDSTCVNPERAPVPDKALHDGAVTQVELF